MPTKRRVTTVGLTGSIGSGKTTILNLFEEFGCKILSADKIAHELLEKDTWVRNKIAAEFGSNIVCKNFDEFRKRLADIIFEDNDKRHRLELLLHPEIENVISRNVNKMPTGSIIVIEAPLLFETCWERKLDFTVLVKCPIEMRSKRYLEENGHSATEFDRRNKLQWEEGKKEKLAHFTIDNSHDLERSSEQIKQIIAEIKESF